MLSSNPNTFSHQTGPSPAKNAKNSNDTDFLNEEIKIEEMVRTI